MDFTLDYMDFILDCMDFTLDYTEIHASDWSEAQSREITLRGIMIRDVCVLSWVNFDLETFHCLRRRDAQRIDLSAMGNHD